jgi:hypothetical protein
VAYSTAHGPAVIAGAWDPLEILSILARASADRTNTVWMMTCRNTPSELYTVPVTSSTCESHSGRSGCPSMRLRQHLLAEMVELHHECGEGDALGHDEPDTGARLQPAGRLRSPMPESPAD